MRSLHTAMEVVVAEGLQLQLSSILCSDECEEQLSKSCDAMLCESGISVHQSRQNLSTGVEVVAKCDKSEEVTLVDCSDSLISQQTVSVRAVDNIGDTVLSVLLAETCTDTVDSCITEDSEASHSIDCARSVAAVTAELGKLDTDAAHSSTEVAKLQCISRPKSLCGAKTMSVCFAVHETDQSVTDVLNSDDRNCVTKHESSKRMSLLLRLFESKLFDMAIALPYLFNSKEPGVLAYLGQ